MIFPRVLLFFLLVASRLAVAAGSGTGFFISEDGYIATNWHVVDGNTDDILVRDSTGSVLNASVVLGDDANDLAVLKVEGRHQPLPIRGSSQVLKGTSVFTLGFPRTELQGFESKVTEGIISSLSGGGGRPSEFQISVPVQPGNSGGPLIDTTGAVVGLTSAKLSANAALRAGSGLPENVNYAVKSNYLLELLGTNPNVRSRITLARSDRPVPLPTLVERAEKSVVFIVVGFRKQGDAEASARPSASPPAAAPPAAAPEPSSARRATVAYDAGIQALRDMDYGKALHQFGVAAGLGHLDAMYRLGAMYNAGQGTPPDASEAARWCGKAAEGGWAPGQFCLGQLYRRGAADGTGPGYAEAMKWFRLAAAQNHAASLVSVGAMYEIGEGVPVNLVEAMVWFRKAAALGNASAQARLGRHYLAGDAGVARDYATALSWLGKAAAQGNADAEALLAECHIHGWGVPVDYQQARALAERSAGRQGPRGQYVLGMMYLKGMGMPADRDAAISWLEKSARGGYLGAKQELAALRPQSPVTRPSAAAAPEPNDVPQPAPGTLLGTVWDVNEQYGYAIARVTGMVAAGTVLTVDTTSGRLAGKAERQAGKDLSLTLTGRPPDRSLVGSRVYAR